MIHNATELMGYIQQVGFLPLLYSGIAGYSADEAVDPDCRYVWRNWPRNRFHEAKITTRFWIFTIILAAFTIITLKIR